MKTKKQVGRIICGHATSEITSLWKKNKQIGRKDIWGKSTLSTPDMRETKRGCEEKGGKVWYRKLISETYATKLLFSQISTSDPYDIMKRKVSI